MRRNWMTLMSALAMACGLMLTGASCSKQATPPTVPGFQAVDAIVDIPPCLTTSSRSAKRAGKVASDSVNGSAVFDLECSYIKLADEMGTMVRGLLGSLQNVAGEYHGTFTNSADGRVKNVVISQLSTTYAGEVYQSRLDIYDSTDLAFQMYYDTGAVVKGVVTMAPMRLDMAVGAAYTDTRVRITYNRNDPEYARSFVIEGTGFPHPLHGDLSALKMHAWIKGGQFYMEGNSNHPNAWLFGDPLTEANYVYSFMARGTNRPDTLADSACMMVALSSDTLSSADSLFTQYSVDKMLGHYCQAFRADLMPDTVARLVNASKNPGWYIRGGSTPGYLGNGPNFPPSFAAWDDWTGMAPYAPAEVCTCYVSFGDGAKLARR